MAEKVQKYRCLVCGMIVEANPDGSCPICGADKDSLVPVDEDGTNQERNSWNESSVVYRP